VLLSLDRGATWHGILRPRGPRGNALFDPLRRDGADRAKFRPADFPRVVVQLVEDLEKSVHPVGIGEDNLLVAVYVLHQPGKFAQILRFVAFDQRPRGLAGGAQDLSRGFLRSQRRRTKNDAARPEATKPRVPGSGTVATRSKETW